VAIFINYRRDDSQAITGRIDDHLRLAFGDRDVYRDIDSIPAGVDFVEHLRGALQQCDLCIAVLGPRWASPRLAQANDFVRLELETMLSRGIPVIPVLVEGGQVPQPEQLPGTLHPLLRRQAVRIDSGADFRMHMQRLVQAIRRIREEKAAAQAQAAARAQPQQPVLPSTPPVAAVSAPPSPSGRTQVLSPGIARVSSRPGHATAARLRRWARPVALGSLLSVAVAFATAWLVLRDHETSHALDAGGGPAPVLDSALADAAGTKDAAAVPEASGDSTSSGPVVVPVIEAGSGPHCPPGSRLCAAACVDTVKDPSNCGGCGHRCAPGLECRGGQCSCPPGRASCVPGLCVDLQADPANCGQCGHRCPVGKCIAGHCDCDVIDYIDPATGIRRIRPECKQ
jgi:hypothetical protein